MAGRAGTAGGAVVDVDDEDNGSCCFISIIGSGWADIDEEDEAELLTGGTLSARSGETVEDSTIMISRAL